MRARFDRIFTIRTPLPGSRCFEMYSNRDWEMGNAGKAAWPAWCSTRVCANTSLYIVRLSTSQLTRRYWVTLYNSVYLILATKYYSGVSTTECLVWLLAIIVPVVSLVLGF